MKMTNRWNRTIYRLWAPVYDSTVNHFFMPGRKRALEVLGLQPGERVLIPGVGTGADLPLLPEGVEAVGVDLSPEMLLKANQKIPGCQASIHLIRGDAQSSLVKDSAFDAAILNLILSVVPDGQACLQSALMALRPGGRAVFFDKFLPEDGPLTIWRRGANFFSTLFGTDVTRRFSDLLAGSPCKIVCDEPSLLRGAYRVILVQKNPFLDSAPPNKHQQYYQKPDSQADCHRPNTIRRNDLPVNRLEQYHNNHVKEECNERCQPGIFVIPPNQQSCDKNAHNTHRKVINGKPINNVITWNFAQQYLPAGENSHRSNDDGEQGGDSLQVCFYLFHDFRSVDTSGILFE